jgi:hypothetical protein
MRKTRNLAVSCRWRKHHKTGVRKIFNIFLIDKRVAVRTIENDPYAQVCSLVRPTFSHPLVLRLSRRVVLRCPAERCRVARYRRERRILFPRTNFFPSLSDSLTLRRPRHFEEQSDEKSPQKPRFLASLETLALPQSKCDSA